MNPELDPVGGAGGKGNAALLGLCVAAALAAAAIFPFDHELSRAATSYEPLQSGDTVLIKLIKAFGKADVLIVTLFCACLTRLRRPAVYGLVSLALVALPVLLLKFAVDRERPEHSGGSFPSGDTASVVAAFVPMALASRVLLVPVVVLVVLVGVFRVVSSWHYPSDVLAGAALGLLGVWAAFRFAPEKLLNPSPRFVLPLLGLALLACGITAATSASNSPSLNFAIYVLPVMLIAVILERRLAR